MTIAHTSMAVLRVRATSDEFHHQRCIRDVITETVVMERREHVRRNWLLGNALTS